MATTLNRQTASTAATLQVINGSFPAGLATSVNSTGTTIAINGGTCYLVQADQPFYICCANPSNYVVASASNAILLAANQIFQIWTATTDTAFSVTAVSTTASVKVFALN